MTPEGVTIDCPNAYSTGMAFRHSSYRGLKSKAPQRTKCAYCGANLTRSASVWAPVEHRGDSFYKCPAVTYPSPELAQEAAEGLQVVRSFPA